MISCVILSHNSQDSIGESLRSVNWCDEVLVIDDASTDNTISIAQKHNAHVYSHCLEDNFAAQRNYGLKQAKGEWVLFLDSDEIVTENLKNEIRHELKGCSDAVKGYYIPRVDFIFGRTLRYGDVRRARYIRLARIGAGKWSRAVHEQWNIKGEIKTFSHPLLHSPHPTLKSFLHKINRYTTINANLMFQEGKRVHCFTIIVYPVAKFLYTYGFQFGFLDGTAGFVHAMMMAFHSFLTRAKLWQLQQGHKKSV